NSLNYPLSVTGSAWSCIGYPPGASGALPGTVDGFCTAPDAYPLTSNIGDIFVYQAYSEGTGGGLQSNHSGSTNRGVFLVGPKTRGTRATSSGLEGDSESGVVYT